MPPIRKNPNHRPFDARGIPRSTLANQVSEVISRVYELEVARDSTALNTDQVHELADLRMRLADYASADTIERFDLDI